MQILKMNANMVTIWIVSGIFSAARENITRGSNHLKKRELYEIVS